MTVLDKTTGHLGLAWVAPPATRTRIATTIVASLLLVAAIAVSDYVSGYETRLAILYLVPIALATWRLGAAAGGAVAAVAALSWLATFASSNPYSHPFYFYWEGAITTIMYLIVVALLTLLRAALARSDRRFVAVLEGLDAAVYVQDSGGAEILFANRRFRDIYGARP